MANPVAVVRQMSMYNDKDPGKVWHTMWVWCPGCESAHTVQLVGPDGYEPKPCWGWDGNLEHPTIIGSILVHASGNIPRCHSHIHGGRWKFLEDCDHHLAGQEVDMVPLPDWLVG